MGPVRYAQLPPAVRLDFADVAAKGKMVGQFECQWLDMLLAAARSPDTTLARAPRLGARRRAKVLVDGSGRSTIGAGLL